MTCFNRTRRKNEEMGDLTLRSGSTVLEGGVTWVGSLEGRRAVKDGHARDALT